MRRAAATLGETLSMSCSPDHNRRHVSSPRCVVALRHRGCPIIRPCRGFAADREQPGGARDFRRRAPSCGESSSPEASSKPAARRHRTTRFAIAETTTVASTSGCCSIGGPFRLLMCSPCFRNVEKLRIGSSRRRSCDDCRRPAVRQLGTASQVLDGCTCACSGEADQVRGSRTCASESTALPQ